MKITAVICEFNPFHNGHAYLLERAKRLTEADAVLCIMSGQFVQRAEPAGFDMRLRAHAALMCGADAVIELPALYASACGERFAEGAVNILNSIPCVTHLVFGSESGELLYLQATAKIQSHESDAFRQQLQSGLNEGISYAAAYCAATESELKQIPELSGRNAPRLPNDLLAVEYCKQLIQTDSKITPVTVKRVGADFHDAAFSGTFSSATAIRAMLKNQEWEQIKQTMPESAYQLLINTSSPAYGMQERFRLLTLHALRSLDLSACPDAGGEGLDKKLQKSATEFTDLERVIASVKSKRYTESRIRRLCLQALLCVTHYPVLSENDSDSVIHIPAKLIGIRKEGKDELLRVLPKNIVIQNKDFDLYRAVLTATGQKTADYVWRVNQTVASIYALATGIDGDPYNGQPLLLV